MIFTEPVAPHATNKTLATMDIKKWAQIFNELPLALLVNKKPLVGEMPTTAVCSLLRIVLLSR